MNKLIKILPIPNNPVENIKMDININLPNDYIEFISIYGSGQIDFFLSIFNYASKNDFTPRDLILDDLQSIKIEQPDYCNFNVYPEKNGLYPFGQTDNGDYLLWKTAGNINDWTVSIIECRSLEAQHTPYNFVDFLYLLLSKEVRYDAFPEDFPSEKIEFQPAWRI
ncbi:SMI1/KNR4 family protein [Pasteurella atlantica]|uniref:SMI1/KNR4 family protein n=1 Tax=Pasteurellaceae TaxID=712 RepID=UPI00274403EC|nr:SMI1/KNR4 family protein [Pasteurella atlantica]MDP8099278.1 SMI1/KNR4 family protein [Pasteurella atlantica]MDP8106163.1 SMI1/KNR4 family protein [Pasteurella atlantica]MDP8115888.1 SMI1/KNR4 family protein [Pasteurella atlantica]